MENVEIKPKKKAKKKVEKVVEVKETSTTGFLGWMESRNIARKNAGLPPAYTDDDIAKEKSKQ